jgi:hypothetical protein
MIDAEKILIAQLKKQLKELNDKCLLIDTYTKELFMESKTFNESIVINKIREKLDLNKIVFGGRE